MMFSKPAALCCALFLISNLYSQNPEWQRYDTLNSELPGNQIECITTDKNDNIWFGTASGLASYDGKNWQVFDTLNSLLPSSFITALYADNTSLWVGTSKGLAKLSGNIWSVYEGNNSVFDLPYIVAIDGEGDSIIWVVSTSDLVKFNKDSFNGVSIEKAIGAYQSLVVDSAGALWVGDFNYLSHNGLIWNFDGSAWDILSLKDYPELISSFPYTITIDKNNIPWFGFGGTTGGGIVKIEKDRFVIFKKENSGFPGDGVDALVIEDNIKWIGSSDGLVSFDDEEWQVFDTTNSELGDNWVTSIAVDLYGNKWIGTVSGGAAVYKKGGIVTSLDSDNEIATQFNILENYPNPFNPATNIKYVIQEASIVNIKIYNMLGEIVTVLYNGFSEKGRHDVLFNAENISSGTYFCILKVQSLITHTYSVSALKILCIK